MIDHNKRMAVIGLHLQGKGKREISRLLSLSRNSVTTIIDTDGRMPQIKRRDKTPFDEDRLRELHHRCDGRVQRIHEILLEEDQFKTAYSSLSQKLRELGLGKTKKLRCERVPDVPGEEMQHDTTLYHIMLGARKVKVVASLLYFRYSKVRYLKFYRSFNRFRMQCFFH